jgi:hypothetical protein
VSAVEQANDALTAAYDRGAVAIYMVGALLFVALGLALWQDPRPDREFAGALAIGFFGLLAVISVPRLFRSGIVLTIDAAGVLDRRVTDRVIPWTAISDVSRQSVRNQAFCVLTLTRPVTEFIDNPVKRLMQALNAPFTGGGITVGGKGLDVSDDDIEYELRRRFKALRAPA